MTIKPTIKGISTLFYCLTFTIALVSFTSCGKDDDKTEDCSDVTTLDGTLDFNNESLALTIAQHSVSAGGTTFGDIYLFQLAGVSTDCNTVQSVNFTITIPSGGSIDGTYPIKNFFDADTNDAYGSTSAQTLNPVTQSISDLESGTVTVVEKGTKLYDIDLTAKVVGGGNVAFSISHQF